MQSVLPKTREAYDLLHQGVIAMAEVESNGMCVDIPYLERAIRKTKRKAKKIQLSIERMDVYREWSKMYGRKMNLNSTQQLGKVLFDGMGFKAPEKTEGGKQHKVDDEALAKVNHPFVADYLRMRRLAKASNTYLKGILREAVEGRIHCFFNLHNTVTYRSSSERINFQNIPVRNPEISKLVRNAFLPSPGNRILEIDFSGAEVIVAACYHKDPVMIDYLNNTEVDKYGNPKKDMHRDMAVEIYKLPPKYLMHRPTDPTEVAKSIKFIRYTAKNQFVFPQFYGDYYIDCARSMWASVDKNDIVLRNGLSLRRHLTDLGIKKLGELNPREKPEKHSFEGHVKEVERGFWDDRFQVYKQWKKDWYSDYQDRGFIETLTGFVCQGYMERNQVINFPVQGSAFHCLLWSLIRLVQYYLPKHGFKSKIVGQIHDSIVFDVVPSEFDDLLALCHRVMTKLVGRHYEKWMIIPMKVEAEAGGIDEPWAEKKKIEFAEAA